MNVCGWTRTNHNLRSEIVKQLNCDIISLNETHLLDENELNLSDHGYKWIGFNRSNIHVNAPNGSVGIGILVKNSLYKVYHVHIIDKSYKGILGVKFRNKDTDFTFVLYSVYLPPENSPWGRDASSLFAHLLTQIYQYSEADAIVICGDFNARIGKTNECNDCVDNIPHRSSTDDTQNQHGKSFLDFLNDSRCCVLNGRFGDQSTGYTSLSTRGHSVVDYICVPHDIFPLCENFRIISCNDIVERYNLTNFLGEKSKTPDHATITFELKVPSHTCNPPVNENKIGIKKRYNLRRIPANFMNTERTRNAILDLISKIEMCREIQDQIDKVYDDFCDTIIGEMAETIPKYDWSNKGRKKLRFHKPYWNDELTNLWKNMRNKEKQYLKCESKEKGTKESFVMITK